MKRAVGPRLRALQARLERWRKDREKGKSRIPSELWAEAVLVARTEGVCATAKALRFNYYDLRKRCEAAAAEHELDGSALAAGSSAVVEQDARATFLQVQMPSSDMKQHGDTMVIELMGRDGHRMRIEARDSAGVDVVGMVQAFWSRPS